MSDTRAPGRSVSFRDVCCQAYEQRVSLGERGFYATPGVDFNRETGRGSPFLYFTNGVACSEVMIDRFTGELTVTRVDLLMDPGRPIKVVFDREKAAHTLFAHQGSLKLTVQCRGGRSYANYLLEEYLIYRAYNMLTERSFRVRLARVTYVDAKGKHEPETRNAFFVEDDDRMARRNGTQVVEQKGVYQSDVDFQQMDLAAVFQYMIGNTDFAVSVLHNIVLIRDTAGVVYPVPYDFDWSGVIWTPYAQPDPRLGIRTVRQRIFRGTCRSSRELAALFVPFNQQKDAIYALYRGMEAEGLEHKRVEQALDYYDEFYKTINDAGRTRREFMQGCRES